jgi:hypothetical protein
MLVVGRKADDLAPSKIIVEESKEVETRSHLAESSKEGCGSKRVFCRLWWCIMTVLWIYILAD